MMRCTRPTGAAFPDPGMSVDLWFASEAPAAPPPPPDPQAIAKELMATITIEPIEPGTTPMTLERKKDVMGAVGLPLWLWPLNPGPTTTGPLSASTTRDGYTVAIRGTLVAIDWDLGDGEEPLHCTRWKPFNPNYMDKFDKVVCGRQFGYEKTGEYTITATSHWDIHWQGIGQSGTFTHHVSTKRTLRIGELHSVIVSSKRR